MSTVIVHFIAKVRKWHITRGGAAARCAEGDRREPFAQRKNMRNALNP